MILSSFFIGYLIAHIPAGYITEKFGGKWTLAASILSVSLCTLATPIALEYAGHVALIWLRILMGLTSGIMFPGKTNFKMTTFICRNLFPHFNSFEFHRWFDHSIQNMFSSHCSFGCMDSRKRALKIWVDFIGGISGEKKLKHLVQNHNRSLDLQ